MIDATAQKRLKTIAHVLRSPQHGHAYDILLDTIIKINKAGDITNRDMDKLRIVLEQLSQVDEVLNEGRRGRNTRGNQISAKEEV